MRPLRRDGISGRRWMEPPDAGYDGDKGPRGWPIRNQKVKASLPGAEIPLLEITLLFLDRRANLRKLKNCRRNCLRGAHRHDESGSSEASAVPVAQDVSSPSSAR